jgi:uncharacterized membrane protein YeaQ/YmgE (transglycosylase-associated protein family)
MGIVSWVVVGLIAGLLARLVVLRDGPRGLIVTTVVGLVGAVVGGALIGILGGVGATGLNVWSILVATLGAIILLFVLRLLTGGRSRRV